MSQLSKRQKAIVRLVQKTGFCTIETLAEHFDLTTQTIRRDINDLCHKNILARHHGGASFISSSTVNLQWQMRQSIHRKEKERIANYVASNIKEGSSLFMNLGTTTELIADRLPKYIENLTLITNNLNIAIRLANQVGYDILVTGGYMRHSDRGVVGQSAIDFVSQFYTDLAIIGISGITGDGHLTDFDLQEVNVAQALIRHAKEVWLVTDSSKFSKKCLVNLGEFDLIDRLITNEMPKDNLRKIIEDHQCEIIVV